MDPKKGIFTLSGKVQHYDWGGQAFIPQLLKIDNPKGIPFAEYWLGAHPSAPSQIIDGKETRTLSQLIADMPIDMLGERTFHKFHGLPYLLKILDVKGMLSIQVHPSREGAEKGFITETAAGVPIDASSRNYKDRNHKPELMVALSEFWLLHGFKAIGEMRAVLNSVEEFSSLIPIFETDGYKGLYSLVMGMQQEQVDRLLRPLVRQELQRKLDGRLSKHDAGWWVAKLHENGCPTNGIDRGIFSIYFFNIVHLSKGEAIFQGAGIPHAYMEGQNIEIMANSDNVLRGGLTSKHIDVDELMKHTLFEAVIPNVIQGSVNGKEITYDCPVPDFGISRIELKDGDCFSSVSQGLEILLVVEGAITIKGQATIAMKGQVLSIFDGCTYSLVASGKTTLFRAFVPQ